MLEKAKSLLTVILLFSLSNLVYAQKKDISRLALERIKLVDGQSSFNTHGISYNHGKAPKANSRDGEFNSVLIDSGRNGYGGFGKTTNPLAYGVDEGYFAVYRQWISSQSTHGIIGAAQSEDGEEWFQSQELNLKYPNGDEAPNLPTATGGGPPQGRYPSAGFWEGAKPTAIWNEYTLPTFGGGQYGGYPLYTFNTLGMGEDAYWIDPMATNNGCNTFPCDPPDLWYGNAMIIPAGNSYKFLGAYNTWALNEYKTYMITSFYQTTSGSFLMNNAYVLSDDLEMTEDGDTLFYGGNYVSGPDYHINADGVGYMVQVGWPNLDDYDGDDTDVDNASYYAHSIFIKKTEDFGETWTDEGGFKNSGYHIVGEAVAHRLTDSLYSAWAAEGNEYYYHYGDTLFYDDEFDEDGVSLVPWLMASGWDPFYTAEIRTDVNGGLHIVFPTTRYVCRDYAGIGCQDLDGDGYADSLYSFYGLGGTGILHIYSPDPMADEDNWTGSLIYDMSMEYQADWVNSNIKTQYHSGEDDFLGTMQYFFPNITMSAESEDVMWFSISGMSEYEYGGGEDSTIIPTDIDVWMAKSTDNGRHWSEPENVTNTSSTGAITALGYPEEAALEYGVHLANQGMDESVGVFYQMMDPNVNTISDNDGYEDYKNWYFVGIYENDWEYTDLATGEEVIPSSFTLKQNFPNPFNPVTQIQYEINSAGQVSLELFDVRGVKVKTLINEHKPVGTYDFTFDGSQLSSGVYFYTMTANDIVQTRKLVLMK